MARPRRPDAERLAVTAAVGSGTGTFAERASRLARQVAIAALHDVDADPDDRVIAILRRLEARPIDILAADPEIDTAALILTERMERLAARAGRRLRECEWDREDREIVKAVCQKLARRYRRILSEESCRKPG